MSNKQEKKVAKEIGGREVIGSGCLWFAPSDVRNDDYLIECKTTKNDYYILHQKTWNKIAKEALSDNMRIPLLQVQLEDGADEILVMHINDFVGLELDKDRYFIGGEQPLLLDRMSFRVTSDFTNIETIGEIPNETYYCRQDVKLVDYDLHLVMIEWEDFLHIMNEKGEIECL